jgi:hypothetical protein
MRNLMIFLQYKELKNNNFAQIKINEWRKKILMQTS